MKPKRNVLVISKADPRFGNFSERLNYYDKIANHDVINIKGASGWLKLIMNLIKNKKFDMVTVQDSKFCGRIGLFLKKKYDIPLNIQVHGFEFFGSHEIERMKQADTIRVVSNQLKKELIKRGIPENKIFVLPVPSILDSFRPQRKLQRFKDRKVILFVGRLVKIKQVDLLIKSMPKIIERHPSCVLVIIGDGPEKENLKRIARSLGDDVVRRTVFEGVIENQKLPLYYSSADVVVLPSVSEGWGLAAIEALACGTPVVITKHSGVCGEVVIDKLTGFCIEPSQKEIVEKVNWILENPSKAKKMGQNGRKIVLEKCDISKSLRKFSDLYEKTVQSK